MIIPLFLGQVLLPLFFRQMCVYAQSCRTLCDPVDCSLPGSSVHAILQARLLEGVAISSSRGSSQTGIKLVSLASGFFTSSTTWEAPRQRAIGHRFFLSLFSLGCFKLEIIHLPLRRFEVANFASPIVLSLLLFVNHR